MYSFLNNTEVSIQALDGAADNETLTGSGVDMQGYDSVAFVTGCLLGEELSLSIKAQQDTVSTFATAHDIEDSSVPFTTDAYTNGLTTLEIHNPQERYVRPLIAVPNANAAKAVFCIAILFNASKLPVGANAGELLVCPGEGTA